MRRSTGDGRSEHEWRDGGGITKTDDVREAVSLRGKPSPHVNLMRDVTVYSVSIYSHVLFLNRCLFTRYLFSFLINLFIYFWLHWVFVAACRLFSSCGDPGLLFIAVASLVAEHGP